MKKRSNIKKKSGENKQDGDANETEVVIVKELVDGLLVDKLKSELQRLGVEIPNKTNASVLRYILIKTLIDNESKINQSNGDTDQNDDKKPDSNEDIVGNIDNNGNGEKVEKEEEKNDSNGDDEEGKGKVEFSNEMIEYQYRSMIDLGSYSYTSQQLELITESHLKDIAKAKYIHVTSMNNELALYKTKVQQNRKSLTQYKNKTTDKNELIKMLKEKKGNLYLEKYIILDDNLQLVMPTLREMLIKEITTKQSVRIVMDAYHRGAVEYSLPIQIIVKIFRYNYLLIPRSERYYVNINHLLVSKELFKYMGEIYTSFKSPCLVSALDSPRRMIEWQWGLYKSYSIVKRITRLKTTSYDIQTISKEEILRDVEELELFDIARYGGHFLNSKFPSGSFTSLRKLKLIGISGSYGLYIFNIGKITELDMTQWDPRDISWFQLLSDLKKVKLPKAIHLARNKNCMHYLFKCKLVSLDAKYYHGYEIGPTKVNVLEKVKINYFGPNEQSPVHHYRQISYISNSPYEDLVPQLNQDTLRHLEIDCLYPKSIEKNKVPYIDWGEPIAHYIQNQDDQLLTFQYLDDSFLVEQFSRFNQLTIFKYHYNNQSKRITNDKQFATVLLPTILSLPLIKTVEIVNYPDIDSFKSIIPIIQQQAEHSNFTFNHDHLLKLISLGK